MPTQLSKKAIICLLGIYKRFLIVLLHPLLFSPPSILYLIVSSLLTAVITITIYIAKYILFVFHYHGSLEMGEILQFLFLSVFLHNLCFLIFKTKLLKHEHILLICFVFWMFYKVNAHTNLNHFIL